MTTSQPLDFCRHFVNLRDPRCVTRTTYRLLDLVFIALCATIAGAQDWHQIETFARKRRDWLSRFCRLPADGQTPSHDTFERLFRSLNPRVFARCFGQWTAALAQALGLKQIAIDGKSLRGSARPEDGLRALHLVSAWATDNQLSLGQVAVDQKSNEITAIPALLQLLDLKGALVSLDAMGCQKAIAQQIVAGGGDYVLPVKDNQKGLYDDILAVLLAAEENDYEDYQYDTYKMEDRGHGRTEMRSYTVLYNHLEDIHDRAKWERLTVIGTCYSERTEGGKTSEELRLFIGSRRASAQVYGEALRNHWGIENNLHWQLDVTFGEDANRVSEGNAAQNLAVLRRLALSLLKRHPDKKSIANKRYAAGLDVSFLEEVLKGGQPG